MAQRRERTFGCCAGNEEWGGVRGSRRPTNGCGAAHGLEEFRAGRAHKKNSPSGPRKGRGRAPSPREARIPRGVHAPARPRHPPPQKLLVALLVAPAAALAPNFGPTAPALDGMPGIGKETGDKAWDPYGFSLKASSETLGWFRAAEIKHGRVAMLAFTGFCVQGAGLGNIPLTPGAAPLSSKPFEALGQVPAAGIAQIVMTIGLIELYSESVKPHYTQGGQPGYLPIIAPSGLADGGVDLRAANKELKNGRLAMIGVMGFFAAAAVPGSVPALGAYAASEGPSSGGGRLGPSPAAPIIVVFVSDALGPRRSYPGLCALGRAVGRGPCVKSRQP